MFKLKISGVTFQVILLNFPYHQIISEEGYFENFDNFWTSLDPII